MAGRGGEGGTEKDPLPPGESKGLDTTRRCTACIGWLFPLVFFLFLTFPYPFCATPRAAVPAFLRRLRAAQHGPGTPLLLSATRGAQGAPLWGASWGMRSLASPLADPSGIGGSPSLQGATANPKLRSFSRRTGMAACPWLARRSSGGVVGSELRCQLPIHSSIPPPSIFCFVPAPNPAVPKRFRVASSLF